MKRILCFLLIFSLLSAFSGCIDEKEPPVVPVNFYYPRAELQYFQLSTDVFGSEQRESLGHQSDLAYLMRAYLSGPQDPALANPFPNGTALEDVRLADNILYITLSNDFGRLQGINLSLACTSIAITGFSITGCSDVRISAAGVTFPTGKWLQIGREDLLLADDSLERLRDSMLIYLVNSQGTMLTGRPVSIHPTSGTTTCADLLEALLQWNGQEEDLFSPIPKGTRLLGVSLEDGLCTVNFSSEFVDNMPTETGRQGLLLQSITNTLTQLNYVSGVLFCCNGTRLQHYGSLDTSNPWTWSSLPLPDAESSPSFSASLYVGTGTGTGLVKIPVNLEAGDPTGKPEQIVQALLDFQPQNGYYTLVPPGTRLVSVTVQDRQCNIRLAGAFPDQPEAAEAAVQSIIVSVCSLPEIDSVRIILNGIEQQP